jgi:hypothetical protein
MGSSASYSHPPNSSSRGDCGGAILHPLDVWAVRLDAGRGRSSAADGAKVAKYLRRAQRAVPLRRQRHVAPRQRGGWGTGSHMCAGHDLSCPYECNFDGEGISNGTSRPGNAADGAKVAKYLRRARLIPQARLTVDLGAPPAVPLRMQIRRRRVCGARCLGVVRGYEENLYIEGWVCASTCWCKEKSSTVWCGVLGVLGRGARDRGGGGAGRPRARLVRRAWLRRTSKLDVRFGDS